MNWRGLSIALLLLGAVLSGWAVWTHRRPSAAPTQDTDRPDYVLHDFELTALNGEGVESFTVRAPTLERRPGDQTLSLTTPLFLVPNGTGQYWEIRAAVVFRFSSAARCGKAVSAGEVMDARPR